MKVHLKCKPLIIWLNVKRYLELSQLITNHYYLECRGDTQHEWMKLGSITCQVTCRWKVAIEKKCLKQLHSVKEREVTNLVFTKRRFNLIVRLITNRYYENKFHFLSFLPLQSGFLICLVPFIIKFLIVGLVEVVGYRHSPWNHPVFLLCTRIRHHPDLFRAHDSIDQLLSYHSPTKILG